MSEINPSRLHVLIKGRVQGVGFRAFVLEHAMRLEVKGWVRNTWDGNVEVLGEGDRTALENLLDLLDPGPRGGFVENLNPEWSQGSGEFSTFKVERTV